MQRANWKDVAELVGIAAIVASLIFVGLQMKQSQEIAVAAQYHERAALAAEMFSNIMESGDLFFWGRSSGLPATSDQTLEDIGRTVLTGKIMLTLMDNHYYQYQAGFLDEDSWQAQRSNLKRIMKNTESMPRLLITQPGSLRTVFIDLCATLIDENKSETQE
jgi:hypothetical protein